jgi:hypothetical protein
MFLSDFISQRRLNMKLSDNNKALLASYGRSVLGAAVSTYVATQDWKLALNALWAAALPVIIRYLNPKDAAFGRTEEGK